MHPDGLLRRAGSRVDRHLSPDVEKVDHPRISEGRHRGRIARLIGALAAALIILAQPAIVYADAFSSRTFEFWITPAGEPTTDYCARSGIVDVARSYGQINAYVNGGGAHDCVGTANSVPSGWLGVQVSGYRDGALCSTSSFYYSTSAANNWQLYVTLCSNPSGTQEFYSRSTIKAYDGQSYWQSTGPFSPIQNY
jgi:hypothetical protein